MPARAPVRIRVRGPEEDAALVGYALVVAVLVSGGALPGAGRDRGHPQVLPATGNPQVRACFLEVLPRHGGHGFDGTTSGGPLKLGSAGGTRS